MEDSNDIYIINANIKHIERTSRPTEEGMAASRAWTAIEKQGQEVNWWQH